MRPEEKCAHRLLERHNINPPYDLEELVSLYAKFEYLDFPNGADGISLKLKQGGKPSVYINSSKPEVRRRFTLAHELGHVIIPWHIGNIISHVDVTGDEEEVRNKHKLIKDDFPSRYKQIEKEANRFAAELLIPTKWLDEVFKNVNISDFEEALQNIINQRRTSKDTALIKVFSFLPPGYVCAEIDGNEIVAKGFMSPNTGRRQLNSGMSYSPELYADCKEQVFFKLGDKRYVLWHFENFTKLEMPDETSPSAWRDVLNRILEDTSLQCKQQSINAVLAAAFNAIKEKSDKEVFSHIIYRYSQRDDLKDFFQHPLFKDYVVKRLKDLRSRHPRQLGNQSDGTSNIFI